MMNGSPMNPGEFEPFSLAKGTKSTWKITHNLWNIEKHKILLRLDDQ
jgi:hypothetical protein